jgi:hypothetical protein
MFEPVAQEQWLTAQQITKRLTHKTSYSRVQEVLQDLRANYEHMPEKPYRQVGAAYLYHPDFVQLVDNRDKTPGVKSKNSNKK